MHFSYKFKYTGVITFPIHYTLTSFPCLSPYSAQVGK